MRTSITVFLLLLCGSVFGQFSKKELQLDSIFSTQDSLPRSVFLDSTLLGKMQVKAWKAQQTWFSTDKNEKHIEMLFDIRCRFSTHDSAMAFHENYLDLNSEYGPEIKQHNIKTKGASGFKVFRAPALINGMAAQSGLQMYCYLFVVDNYFVKIYVNCNKSYGPEKFQDLITESIKRIKKQ